MSKKKRTFHSDIVTTTSLRLQQTDAVLNKTDDQTYPEAPKKQIFSPELITRLTERIKKL
jgi:hypothetical protein